MTILSENYDPDSVWRNFYKLFPGIYFAMREEAKRTGQPDGGTVIRISGSIHSWKRHVKLRVLNLDGEFIKVAQNLINDKHLYWSGESSILNSKEAQNFIERL